MRQPHGLTICSDKQKAAVRYRINAIGLSDHDKRAYEATQKSIRLRDALTQFSETRKALDSVAKQQNIGNSVQSVMSQERAALESARNEVSQSLSVEGRATLERYVQTQVKRKIKLLRGGLMSPPKQ